MCYGSRLISLIVHFYIHQVLPVLFKRRETFKCMSLVIQNLDSHLHTDYDHALKMFLLRVERVQTTPGNLHCFALCTRYPYKYVRVFQQIHGKSLLQDIQNAQDSCLHIASNRWQSEISYEAQSILIITLISFYAFVPKISFFSFFYP